MKYGRIAILFDEIRVIYDEWTKIDPYANIVLIRFAYVRDTGISYYMPLSLAKNLACYLHISNVGYIYQKCSMATLNNRIRFQGFFQKRYCCS